MRLRNLRECFLLPLGGPAQGYQPRSWSLSRPENETSEPKQDMLTPAGGLMPCEIGYKPKVLDGTA